MRYNLVEATYGLNTFTVFLLPYDWRGLERKQCLTSRAIKTSNTGEHYRLLIFNCILTSRPTNMNISSVNLSQLKPSLDSAKFSSTMSELLGFYFSLSKFYEVRQQKVAPSISRGESDEDLFYKLAFKYLHEDRALELEEPSHDNIYRLANTKLNSQASLSQMIRALLEHKNAQVDKLDDLGTLEAAHTLEPRDKLLLKYHNALVFAKMWVESIVISSRTMTSPAQLYILSDKPLSQKNISPKVKLLYSAPIEDVNTLNPAPQSSGQLPPLAQESHSLELIQALSQGENVRQYYARTLSALHNWVELHCTSFEWEIDPDYIKNSWDSIEYVLQKCEQDISQFIHIEPQAIQKDEDFFSVARLFFSHLSGAVKSDDYNSSIRIDSRLHCGFGSRDNVVKGYNTVLKDPRVHSFVLNNIDLCVPVITALYYSTQKHSYHQELFYTGYEASARIEQLMNTVVQNADKFTNFKQRGLVDLISLTKTLNSTSPWVDIILNNRELQVEKRYSIDLVEKLVSLAQAEKNTQLLTKILYTIDYKKIIEMGYREKELLQEHFISLPESELKNIISQKPQLYNLALDNHSRVNLNKFLANKSEAFFDDLWARALSSSDRETANICFYFCQESSIKKFKTDEYIAQRVEKANYSFNLNQIANINVAYILKDKERILKALAHTDEINLDIIADNILFTPQILNKLATRTISEYTRWGDKKTRMNKLQNYLSLEEQKSLASSHPVYYPYCCPEVRMDKSLAAKYICNPGSKDYAVQNVPRYLFSDPQFCAQVLSEGQINRFLELKGYIDENIWNNKIFCLKAAQVLDKHADTDEYKSLVNTMPAHVKKFFTVFDLKPGKISLFLESYILNQELKKKVDYSPVEHKKSNRI